MAILACSGPATATVAPFGGMCGLFAPNPLAAGIPTHGDPVLLDISASITTNNRAKQLAHAGQRFLGCWALDAAGHPTDDPSVLASGEGSLLPIGGLDHGHKGYGLALLVESIMQGLSGLSRSSPPATASTNIFLQVIDPSAFGGQDAFLDESAWMTKVCRSNPPRPCVECVRVPREQGLDRLRLSDSSGVPLQSAIVRGLTPYLENCALQWPAPLPSAT